MLKQQSSADLANITSIQEQQVVDHDLYISFARNPSEIAEAQRLRYKVFAEEMGANIQSEDGLDQDGFDAFCDHLLIRESTHNQVAATYRILRQELDKQEGGY